MADGDISSRGEAASLAGERFADAATEAGACIGCGEIGPCRCDPRTISAEAARRSFEPNPDHVAAPGMRRSIHRSHRGEGFNHVD